MHTDSKSLVSTLLAAWEAPFATEYDHRHLLKLAAEEIQRLRKVNQDYADVCAISAREIRDLRTAAGLPVDGLSGWEASLGQGKEDRPAEDTPGASE